MKRFGLFLFAVVMVAGMVGCGGPPGSTEDISGQWYVTIDGVTPFTMTVTQDADGKVTGYRNEMPTYSIVEGKLEDADTNTYSLKAALLDPNRKIWIMDSMRVVLFEKREFEGRADHLAANGTVDRDKACRGQRAD